MWLPTTVILIIMNTILFSIAPIDPLIVTLPKGKIRGRVLKTGKNNTYYAFQEIPYAAPPVGALRFSEPVDHEGWNGVLNTTQNTKICHQPYESSTENVTQTEDCLYINVYTPVAPGETTDELLPVLFFIHPGGFRTEDGTYQRYGPQYFIDHQVVVVTMNYRLGLFGFLYTSDGLIPANNGLKDQLMALRWANENIALFGGNPEKITIAGESAGAASVAYHIVSKKSTGLFRAAILQSGTSLCDFAYQPHGDYFAYRLGNGLDSSLTTSNTSQELLKVLRSASAEDLNAVIFTDIPADKVNEALLEIQGFIWAPAIERSDYPNAVVTNSTFKDLDRGNFNQVPILIGFNSEESLIFLSFSDLPGEAFDNNLVWAVGINLNLNSSSAEEAGKLVRSIYTNSTFGEDYQALARMGSEKGLVTPILKHAGLQSEYTDVYVYQFSYKGVMAGLTYNTIAGKDVESVTHTEELYYMWSKKFNEDVTKFPASDVLTLNRMTKMWTNFVKYLNPTPEKDELLDNLEWPKFKSDNMRYVNITETLDIKVNPKNFARWNEIINEYGVRPFITY